MIQQYENENPFLPVGVCSCQRALQTCNTIEMCIQKHNSEHFSVKINVPLVSI